jgi:tripartite-type tricarboxylate transporter receptor subunit TctC
MELGYAKLELTDWQAVVAPATTPSALVTRLHTEIAKLLGVADVRKRFDALGMPVAGWGPERFAPYLHSEIQRWRTFILSTGIKAD